MVQISIPYPNVIITCFSIPSSDPKSDQSAYKFMMGRKAKTVVRIKL